MSVLVSTNMTATFGDLLVTQYRRNGSLEAQHLTISHHPTGEWSDRYIESMYVAQQLVRPCAVLKDVQLVYHSSVYLMRPCPAVQTTSPGHRQHTSPISQLLDERLSYHGSNTQRLLGATTLYRIEFGCGCRGHGFKFAQWYDRYLWYLYFRPVT